MIPSVFVTERSPLGTRVSVSVDVLFAGVVSGYPVGGVTVAVLVSEPVAVESTVPVTVKTALPPGLTVTAVEMLPEPDAAPQAEPALAAHVQVGLATATGIVSATVALTAVEGPALETVIVYVIGEPGVAMSEPSVLLIERSPVGDNVSVSLAELLAALDSTTPDGTATDAEFTTEPVAPGESVAVTE